MNRFLTIQPENNFTVIRLALLAQLPTLARQLLATTVIMSCLFNFAFADEFYNHQGKYNFYKWTDSEGNTHYSQTPPANEAQAENISSIKAYGGDTSGHESAMKALNDKRAKTLEAIERRENPNYDIEKQQAKNKEIQKANCERAKKNLNQLSSGGNIKVSGGSDTEYLDADSLEQHRQTNQKYISDHCSN